MSPPRYAQGAKVLYFVKSHLSDSSAEHIWEQWKTQPPDIVPKLGF
jgi:hypothetical protein